MKRFLMLLSAASLLVVVSGASFAQFGDSEITPPDKGTAEVSLGLNAQLLSPADYTIQLSYLPYLNRNLQVGGGLTYSHQAGTDDYYSYSSVGLSGTVVYNFVAPEGPVSRWIPYVGAQLSYVRAESGPYDADATAWSLFGGAKMFITPSVAVSPYLMYSGSSDEVFRDGEKSELRLVVALSTFLNMGDKD